jgi:hypothetical protein
MGRNRQHPPIGQYKPKPYRVVVVDTFKQHRLALAALVIRNGWTVPQFLLYAADYVIAKHPELKHLRSVFRKGERNLSAAVKRVPGTKWDPVTPGESSLESRRERAREEAFERFARWAESELHEDITGEKR